jgi:hypothetical protein
VGRANRGRRSSAFGRARPKPGQLDRKPGKPAGRWGIAACLVLPLVFVLLLGAREVAKLGSPTALASSDSNDPGSSSPIGSEPMGPTHPPATAEHACRSRLAQWTGERNPLHVSLVAVYASNASDAAADDERQHGEGYRSAWRDRPGNEAVAVCWFDSDMFAGVPTDAEGRESAGYYDRVEELVRPDGTPVVHRKGRQASLQPGPVASQVGQ